VCDGHEAAGSGYARVARVGRGWLSSADGWLARLRGIRVSQNWNLAGDAAQPVIVLIIVIDREAGGASGPFS